MLPANPSGGAGHFFVPIPSGETVEGPICDNAGPTLPATNEQLCQQPDLVTPCTMQSNDEASRKGLDPVQIEQPSLSISTIATSNYRFIDHIPTFAKGIFENMSDSPVRKLRHGQLDAEGRRRPYREWAMSQKDPLDFPPANAPFHVQAEGSMRRIAKFILDVKDDSKAERILAAVQRGIADGVKHAIDNGYYSSPTESGTGAKRAPRKARTVDPSRQMAPFAWDWTSSKPQFAIINAELDKHGITMDSINEHADHPDLGDGQDLLDDVHDRLGRSLINTRDFAGRITGFDPLVHRNLFMYCLWEVQQCRGQIKYYGKRLNSTQNTKVFEACDAKVRMYQRREKQHLALAIELNLKHSELKPVDGGEILDDGMDNTSNREGPTSDEEPETSPASSAISPKTVKRKRARTESNDEPESQDTKKQKMHDDSDPLLNTEENADHNSGGFVEQISDDAWLEELFNFVCGGHTQDLSALSQLDNNLVMADLSSLDRLTPGTDPGPDQLDPPHHDDSMKQQYLSQVWRPKVEQLLNGNGYPALQHALADWDQVIQIVTDIGFDTEQCSDLTTDFKTGYEQWVNQLRNQQEQHKPEPSASQANASNMPDISEVIAAIPHEGIDQNAFGQKFRTAVQYHRAAFMDLVKAVAFLDQKSNRIFAKSSQHQLNAQGPVEESHGHEGTASAPTLRVALQLGKAYDPDEYSSKRLHQLGQFSYRFLPYAAVAAQHVDVRKAISDYVEDEQKHHTSIPGFVPLGDPENPDGPNFAHGFWTGPNGHRAEGSEWFYNDIKPVLKLKFKKNTANVTKSSSRDPKPRAKRAKPVIPDDSDDDYIP